MLNKLRILAFRDKELHSKAGEFTLQINPETYRRASRTMFSPATGADTAGTMQKFRSYYPQTIGFDFVLDATGAVPGVGAIPGVTDVAKEIQKLRDVVYDYHGTIHSPYYLKLLWGGLAFKCVLESLDIEYLLFAPTGQPLRARLSASFLQHETPQDLARKADKKSADLTHSRLVIGADTLPNLSARVYDRPDLYIGLARFNDLDDIMHPTPGRRLQFPPLGG